MTDIGTLREQHLHASLKEWYREPDDLVEVELAGFVIDLVRGDELIEIQTRNFSQMRRKLDRLLDGRRVRLVHPISSTKWIRKVDKRGRQTSRRRSPKKGIVADVCSELVSFPTLLSHPNLTLEVVMVEEEEVRRPETQAERRKRRWSNGWTIEERRLVSVEELHRFDDPDDLLRVLPDGLPDPFTTAEIANGLKRSRHLAQEVAYCLREAGVLISLRSLAVRNRVPARSARLALLGHVAAEQGVASSAIGRVQAIAVFEKEPAWQDWSMASRAKAPDTPRDLAR